MESVKFPEEELFEKLFQKLKDSLKLSAGFMWKISFSSLSDLHCGGFSTHCSQKPYISVIYAGCSKLLMRNDV